MFKKSFIYAAFIAFSLLIYLVLIKIQILNIIIITIFLWIGLSFLFPVLYILFFGKKTKASILAVKTGANGINTMSNSGRNRKYLLRFNINNKECEKNSIFSMSGYKKNDLINIFVDKKCNFIILNDIFIFIIFAAGFVYASLKTFFNLL